MKAVHEYVQLKKGSDFPSPGISDISFHLVWQNPSQENGKDSTSPSAERMCVTFFHCLSLEDFSST